MQFVVHQQATIVHWSGEEAAKTTSDAIIKVCAMAAIVVVSDPQRVNGRRGVRPLRSLRPLRPLRSLRLRFFLESWGVVYRVV